MNKAIGLILLTLGIGLTAGFGANLSPQFRQATLAEGELALAEKRADTLHEAYCASRKEHKMADADGCGKSDPLKGTSAEKLVALEQNSEIMLVKVTHARTEYRIALKKIAPLEGKVESLGTQGPVERLSGWQSVGGAGFLVGLGLLLVGAWMCRKAAGDLATEDEGPDAVDFGVLLGEVRTSIEVMATDMNAMKAPNGTDLDGIKESLEAVQKDALARLCASGPRVQQRYGLQGMASLFSPLSSAERKLNRAWAALVDRHWPEALSSIEGAAADLSEAQAALSELA